MIPTTRQAPQFNKVLGATRPRPPQSLGQTQRIEPELPEGDPVTPEVPIEQIPMKQNLAGATWTEGRDTTVNDMNARKYPSPFEPGISTAEKIKRTTAMIEGMGKTNFDVWKLKQEIKQRKAKGITEDDHLIDEMRKQYNDLPVSEQIKIYQETETVREKEQRERAIEMRDKETEDIVARNKADGTYEKWKVAEDEKQRRFQEGIERDRRRKEEKQRRDEMSKIFQPMVDGLTKFGDLAVTIGSFGGMNPFITEMYKKFAPPGSKYYNDKSMEEKFKAYFESMIYKGLDGVVPGMGTGIYLAKNHDKYAKDIHDGYETAKGYFDGETRARNKHEKDRQDHIERNKVLQPGDPLYDYYAAKSGDAHRKSHPKKYEPNPFEEQAKRQRETEKAANDKKLQDMFEEKFGRKFPGSA